MCQLLGVKPGMYFSSGIGSLVAFGFWKPRFGAQDFREMPRDSPVEGFVLGANGTSRIVNALTSVRSIRPDTSEGLATGAETTVEFSSALGS